MDEMVLGIFPFSVSSQCVKHLHDMEMEQLGKRIRIQNHERGTKFRSFNQHTWMRVQSNMDEAVPRAIANSRVRQ
jgi:hypothetical protein